MTETEERAYIQGERMVYRELMALGLRGLQCCVKINGPGDQSEALALEVARLTWILEDTRIALRDLSRDLGCADWPDDLHLADVVEKYVARAVEASNENPRH